MSTSSVLPSAVALTRSPSADTALCSPGVSTNTICGIIARVHAHHTVAGGLGFVGDDADLATGHGVHDRRLPTFGRPSNATNPDRNSAITRRTSRLHLVQLAGVDVVDETAHVVLVEHERRHPDPANRLLGVEERIVERLQRPRRLDAASSLELRA